MGLRAGTPLTSNYCPHAWSLRLKPFQQLKVSSYYLLLEQGLYWIDHAKKAKLKKVTISNWSVHSFLGSFQIHLLLIHNKYNATVHCGFKK